MPSSGFDRTEVVGLNRIFCHREDDAVRLEDSIAKRMHKALQKPDAIFGLQATRNLENLLYDTKKRKLDSSDDPRQLHELLDPSPLEPSASLRKTGVPLLYPFVVVEAKKGTSDCDWHSINMQTAFPIRAFLLAQGRLRKAIGVYSERQFEPLLWYFAYKGEDWRLSVAYMKQPTSPSSSSSQQSATLGEPEFVWQQPPYSKL